MNLPRTIPLFIFSCLLVILWVVGCAWTRVASQVDAQYANRPYNKIMVFVPLADLELRREAEFALQSKMSGGKATIVPAHQLFFPGRQYSNDETASLILENDIDGVLVVNVSSTGTSQTYVPPTYQTRSNAYIYGNYLSGTSTTQTYGGYNINKPWASFTAQLIDVETGQVVWISTATTRGNAFAGGKTLLRSMAGKMTKKLFKDGMIK